MPREEEKIELKFIECLKELKYTYRRDIRNKASLERNFREKFETLNKVQLTDVEFTRLHDDIVTADIFKASKTLRERNTFMRDDGTALQYTLVNIKEWCKNEFEVINQLRINTDKSYHRYDVILLLNGLPVVQIELKALDIVPNVAVEQIVNYKNDIGNGYTNTLLCFMQLFIVSNGNSTHYFTNNNSEHFAFNADERYLPTYQLTDKDNNKITHLHPFSAQFLAKCALGEIISRYMVLVESEQKLMIMRPYQIYAVKAIIDCIQQNRGNGYIWHTTGSGKTLTSFKASTLLKDNPNIDKCLFVVDRKDLDKQTRDEFNKFQTGCVEENTNTETLVQRMLSEDYADKVIVTTIQKLGLALDENRTQHNNGKPSYKARLQTLREKRIIFIFDECHRSQFGDNHQAIKTFFPKAQLFGFTGTPIFEQNSTYRQIDGTQASYVTTQDIFQQQLHTYTITNAIEDKNVLKFHIDYYSNNNDTPPSPEIIVNIILDKHHSATHSRRFNALFATASIDDAINYYQLFKTTQAERKAANDTYEQLNIACVFSPPAEGNKDVKQLQDDLAQEREDNKYHPEHKKAALTAIMDDYNAQYGKANYSINTFDVYYNNIQTRIRNQKDPNATTPQKAKIDITIVVDMLLTGFDSKYLNTLYVDKNLKYHSLIQAFSRTNRILNSTKPHGHILDFRYQETAVDNAIVLFSGQDTERAKTIWVVDSVEQVIQQYNESITKLQQFMHSQGLSCEPESVHNLKGDIMRTEFATHFKAVQRLSVQLEQYTNLTQQHKEDIEALLPEQQRRGFKGAYLEIAQRLKEQQSKQAPSEVQQFDPELVLFASAMIDYDYIMRLIAKYTQSKPSKHTMSREQLIQLLSSNANLMNERDTIIAYIDTLQIGAGLNENAIRQGYQTFKAQQSQQELIKLAQKHGLAAKQLQNFVTETINKMRLDENLLTELFEPLNLDWKEHSQKEEALVADLKPIFNKMTNGGDILGLEVYE